MRINVRPAVGLLLLFAMGACQLPRVHGATPGSSRGVATNGGCRLTEDDFKANAALSFADFDQQGVLRSTSRSLSENGCFAEASKASERYLVEGPLAERRQQSALIWHLGQDLAIAGERDRAASVMSAARRPQAPDDDLDWNTYVEGTWAFLKNDRPRLIRSIQRLEARGSSGDEPNLDALQRLLRCFGQTYRVAYLDEACEKR